MCLNLCAKNVLKRSSLCFFLLENIFHSEPADRFFCSKVASHCTGVGRGNHMCMLTSNSIL